MSKIRFTSGEVYDVDNGYIDIGLSDTMEDLFVNFEGALWFSVIGFLHIKNRDFFLFSLT